MHNLTHVFVVDDDDGVREVLGELLETEGYFVSLAKNGAEMREFFDTGMSVDIVLLACLMPGENSASLAQHLKDLGIPVLLLSGTSDEQEFAQAIQTDVILKPFRSADLFSAIQGCLQHSHAHTLRKTTRTGS